MKKIFINNTKENKKILEDLGFELTKFLERNNNPNTFIEIHIKGNYCLWSNALYKENQMLINKDVSYSTIEQFLEKYKGSITMNKLNLL